jgi:hypothetical protein
MPRKRCVLGKWHAERGNMLEGLHAKGQHAVAKHAGGGGGVQLRGDMWGILFLGGWEAV